MHKLSVMSCGLVDCEMCLAACSDASRQAAIEREGAVTGKELLLRVQVQSSLMRTLAVYPSALQKLAILLSC